MDYFVGRAIPVKLNKKLDLICPFSDGDWGLIKQEMHKMLALRIRRFAWWMLTGLFYFKWKSQPTRRR